MNRPAENTRNTKEKFPHSKKRRWYLKADLTIFTLLSISHYQVSSVASFILEPWKHVSSFHQSHHNHRSISASKVIIDRNNNHSIHRRTLSRLLPISSTSLYDQLNNNNENLSTNTKSNESNTKSNKINGYSYSLSDLDAFYSTSENNNNFTANNSMSGMTNPESSLEFDNNDFQQRPITTNNYITNGNGTNNNGSSIITTAEDNPNKYRDAPTAPEVNKWTTIMTAGTSAAVHRPGKYESMEYLYDKLKDMSSYDKAEVEKYWDRIMPTVSYLGTEKVTKVKDALRVAYCAHRGQARKSGEPFIIHPVEVALLLSGLQMDMETVIAGLLHDTVEDTDLTFNQVESMFGHVVRSIVEGETKVSKLPKLAFNNYADEQAENLRQMFVAMTDDYRIIIVKLADRLHNMRTLRYMKPEKQIKISRETLDIFAPLAHRMGIWQFKSELEDTAFMYLYPQEYKRLNRRLRLHQNKFRDTLDKSQQLLKRSLDSDRTLKEQCKSINVAGRTKELYSLWHKMESRGETNLDQITDVVALRVILEPKEPVADQEQENDSDRGVWLCYHVLGLVQHLPGFQPVPTKVKDYISFPKPNGYQSLHTALMLNGQTIEVQIRTAAMHQVAEYGMAAHWAYKEGKRRAKQINDEFYNTPWLSSIKEWQNENEMLCSRDFVDCIRRELLGKRVFVFLRNGKILNLAKGSTVIDAAFQIHTEVGLNMHGVEINGKPVPFSYELKNGDVVSVLTGKGRPATDWMRFANIRSTRSKLRQYFRKKQRESLRDAGKILFLDILSKHHDLIKKSSYIQSDFQVPRSIGEVISFLPGKTKYTDIDEMLIDIGKSHDRNFLRSVVSKLFLVPQLTLLDAEKGDGSAIANNILNAVDAKRKNAIDAGAALNDEDDDIDTLNSKDEDEFSANELELLTMRSKLLNGVSVSSNNTYPTTIDSANAEIADPENICSVCLPILGDPIIGTRPIGNKSDFVTVVHRCGCSVVKKLMDEVASVTEMNDDVDNNPDPNNKKYDSMLKQSIRSRLKFRLTQKKSDAFTSTTAPQSPSKPKEEVVPLKWDETISQGEGYESLQFNTELSVVAMDRKLLLADCSEVVSDMSEIVRTGSLTSGDKAFFEYIVKVKSLEQLNRLMNSLKEVPSVISVERKIG